MAEFEAEGKQANIWNLAALLMALFAFLVLFSKLAPLGLVLLLMAGLFFLMGRRGLTTMRSYTIMDDRIVVEGTDMSIQFSSITDVEPSSFRLMKVWMHNDYLYYANKKMTTNLLSFTGQMQEVLVYTNETNKALFIYGFPYNCYVLTPKDGQAFIQELKEKLEKYRASHPQPSSPTQTPP